jgi:hypothetical protein
MMSAGMYDEADDVRFCRNGSRNVMSPITACRAVATGFVAFLTITLFCITSCATISHHDFSEPVAGWQIKSGQLMYRTPNTTLIGEALVRFSKTGDFELTVSKGPGITLLSLRQDASFAEVKGGWARQGWSGPLGQAPPQLRGWLGLRDQFLHAPDRKTLRYASGNETFVFRF